MLARRKFLKTASVLSAGLLSRPARAQEGEATDWFMPDEADPHQRTWMAFGASEEIWEKKQLSEVRRNLATIARAIAKHEPVSMLVRPEEHDLAEDLVGSSVELIAHPLDDLWMRDTGPVFVLAKGGKKGAIDFNFNGWGRKQEHADDAQVAEFVADRAGVPVIHTDLVLEGGGIEVDGHGTAIITESCVLIANRNPGASKGEVEAKLGELLGLKKIIWLPGIRGKDITDGHTDFYARFARPGVVVVRHDPDPKSYDHAVTEKHIEILRASKDGNGEKLDVVVLEAPEDIRETYETDDFAAGYIGFYVCNGAVIAQEFGDKQADRAAKEALKKAFPDREIVQLNIDGIASGGGSIHCSTQQEPKARS